ncbi:hypothetical protein M9H77_27784 [Catharanthus roseus]|uniref:Uncharacterized protein n=1 Tax=Catharanthus roseus TaxID=4058 RepID=A0ACC0AE36_CATRO|nr:hypothetical protein M9H77_27784 [Catharanthus roseus]
MKALSGLEVSGLGTDRLEEMKGLEVDGLKEKKGLEVDGPRGKRPRAEEEKCPGPQEAGLPAGLIQLGYVGSGLKEFGPQRMEMGDGLQQLGIGLRLSVSGLDFLFCLSSDSGYP